MDERRMGASVTLYCEYGDGEPVCWWCVVYGEDGQAQIRYVGSTGTQTTARVALRDGMRLLRQTVALKELDHVLQ